MTTQNLLLGVGRCVVVAVVVGLCVVVVGLGVVVVVVTGALVVTTQNLFLPELLFFLGLFFLHGAVVAGVVAGVVVVGAASDCLPTSWKAGWGPEGGMARKEGNPWF